MWGMRSLLSFGGKQNEEGSRSNGNDKHGTGSHQSARCVGGAQEIKSFIKKCCSLATTNEGSQASEETGTVTVTQAAATVLACCQAQL